ncbi:MULTISPECIES: type IV secretory system conjugative DNA transfer family protein [Paenarthrobacter]|uniref:TraM recognition domain-containing protein n=1 Tax=Paenarthrobacter ureafaciens TaxID=37931 RepID=A0AAX3EQD7_PAEUR|nr:MULTISPECIES: TraM recognition domain-containing protein [Paenarthrobacter]MDO5867125.1 TraM recognition domain-containing protein [Paenarthrobacter sp. SD-2]MDO5878379.1 TraM recognition domain-containing protein [Paenarthrobacter sp. SD-1]UYV95565.1 TraM recognition domain-containing protein [Paenarthrobacter ureafaciens]UYW00249.1 TraM recognition domain-containing protein [Paenarthrobacter ureafaciens]
MNLALISKPKRKVAPAGALFIGLPLGRSVNGGKELWASLEDVGLVFAGPRTGKSTAYAVPFILAAQGPLLVTTNKNDLHHHTRAIREEMGRVFVADPECIATTEDQGWRVELLRDATTSRKANELADVFEATAGDGVEASVKSKGVDFFPQRAKALLAGLFLAASVSQGWTEKPHTYTGPKYFLRDITAWLAEPAAENPAPLEILDQTEFREVTAELVGIYSGDSPQERSGVFSTAQAFVKCLLDEQLMDWLNPRPGEEDGDGRLIFDARKFMEGNNTIYLLSTDDGPAKTLMTALTQSVIDEAQAKAKQQPRGRLAVPMVCVLDEAANVCPWPRLPKLYSFFGSQGILVWTFLQSYSQGVRVWGEHGMKALMEAANHRIYGGGNLPGPLLDLFSAAIGDYYYTTPGSPASKGSPAGPRQEHKDKIFDPSELQALPRGRAILLSSGNLSMLVRTVPWMAGPQKDAVEASVAKYDPKADQTLRAEMAEYKASLSDPNMTVGTAV